ncbi:hypothetical protein J6590_052636 [Homalodisca vitripennis]|nr:hypothetical protein J6590_052636 [Homalodisca vitripennis]
MINNSDYPLQQLSPQRLACGADLLPAIRMLVARSNGRSLTTYFVSYLVHFVLNNNITKYAHDDFSKKWGKIVLDRKQRGWELGHNCLWSPVRSSTKELDSSRSPDLNLAAHLSGGRKREEDDPNFTIDLKTIIKPYLKPTLALDLLEPEVLIEVQNLRIWVRSTLAQAGSNKRVKTADVPLLTMMLQACESIPLKWSCTLMRRFQDAA